MANAIKITFTGGSLLGEEIVLSLEAPVLIGRSHSCDVRLKEPDVSARHIELTWVKGGVNAKCLSSHGFRWQGEDIAEGESQALRPRDVVSLGSRARFRVDSVSGGVESAGQGEGATEATRAVTLEQTVATQFAQPGEETFATRIGEVTLPSDIEHAPCGSLKESPVTDSDSFAGIPSAPPVETPANSAASAPLDDAPTADEPPPPPPVPPAPPPPQQDATVDFGIPQDDAPTGTNTGLSGDGETQEMKTRQASMDEIFRMKRMLEAKRRFRRKLVSFALLAFVALLATVIFVTWSRPEEELSQPRVSGTDDPDIGEYPVESAPGVVDMVVDYPNDPRMNVRKSEDGIEVSSYTGRDRSAPFRLSFIRRSDMHQYHLSLAESAEQEVRDLEKQGYLFLDEKNGSSSSVAPGIFFYERETPKACAVMVQQGTLFFRREYQREEGGFKWHGMMTLLRDRATVYRLLREVPDDIWPRARYMFHVDPNLTLLSRFLRRRWESPGDEAIKGIVADERLAHAIVTDLARGRTVDWPRLTREIDALVVAASSGSSETRKQADKLLRDLRKRKDALYLELKSRLNRAMINGDEEEMKDATKKCEGAFGADTLDLRSWRVLDPKEWPQCLSEPSS